MRKKYFKNFKVLVIFLIVFLFPKISFAFNNEFALITGPETQIIAPEEEIEKWIQYGPYLSRNASHNSTIENIDYCEEENDLMCSLLIRLIDRPHIQKSENYTFDEIAIAAYLEKISPDYKTEPKNAMFTFTEIGLVVLSNEVEGRSVNITKSKNRILSQLQRNYQTGSREIPLVFDTIEPEIKSSDIEQFKSLTVIGEGKSNFYGSTANRIHNISTAVERFHGIIIKPGEEFSFVENLGPVDGEHGYTQELVIKKDKTEPEFGGGVCQVSTTMFRAAIYSGLKITARRNHAYPVSYYNPQGMDSTVYVPKPDLKFINNTPGYILIQADLNIDTKSLIFKFYGTNDNRKVEVDGPHITSREADGSMKTIFTQTVSDSSGNTIVTDTFKSFYDSPSKYPHPGQDTKLTSKPNNWSNKQWDEYKKLN